MFRLKVLFTCICLQAAATAAVFEIIDDFPDGDLNEAVPVANEDVIPKAIWSPVCQSVEVNPMDEFIPSEANVNFPGVVISPVRLRGSNGDSCDAPNGMGLKNLLKQSKALIPFDRLKAIISNATNDDEVKRLRELIHSDEFQSKLHVVLESSHFAIFRDYACKALNLDIAEFWRFIKSLTPIESPDEIAATEAIENAKGQTGLFGLTQDLYNALPRQKLRDLYRKLLISDDQLRTAMRRMKSDEFWQLFENLTNVKEAKEIRELLEKANVPLQSFAELIGVTMGWYFNELEEEYFEKI